jgi:hypothetical protein
MGIATGSTIVSTNFDVPSSIETGGSTLVVVANGIPSAGIAVTVGSGGGKTSTTTTLTSSPNPSNTGQTVTLTATVKPVNSPAPTGTVAFTSNGASISACSAVALNGSGVATCTTSFATAGTLSLVATYSGDNNYTGSTSNTVSQVVNGGTGSTTTKLMSSKNPSIVKQAVRFIAQVNPKTATGTVKFTVNNKAITNCTAVALASGQAACGFAFPQTGTYSMVAIYSGDSTHSGSTSNTVSQVVNSQ